MCAEHNATTNIVIATTTSGLSQKADSINLLMKKEKPA